MEYKFQVGDKVFSIELNQWVVIIHIDTRDDDLPYEIEMSDNDLWWVSEDDLEDICEVPL